MSHQLTLYPCRWVCHQGALREYSRQTKHQWQWTCDVKNCQRSDQRAYIVSEAQHDLRSAVPSGGDILGHKALISSNLGRPSSRSISPGKTKIADFELAVGIDKKIPWFQVAVENVRRMNVLESAKCLIDKRLEVGIRKGLSGANLLCI